MLHPIKVVDIEITQPIPTLEGLAACRGMPGLMLSAACLIDLLLIKYVGERPSTLQLTMTGNTFHWPFPGLDYLLTQKSERPLARSLGAFTVGEN